MYDIQILKIHENCFIRDRQVDLFVSTENERKVRASVYFDLAIIK